MRFTDEELRTIAQISQVYLEGGVDDEEFEKLLVSIRNKATRMLQKREEKRP